jgi:drug/metabolite transporter (DMT)-like permease
MWKGDRVRWRIVAAIGWLLIGVFRLTNAWFGDSGSRTDFLVGIAFVLLSVVFGWIAWRDLRKRSRYPGTAEP